MAHFPRSGASSFPQLARGAQGVPDHPRVRVSSAKKVRKGRGSPRCIGNIYGGLDTPQHPSTSGSGGDFSCSRLESHLILYNLCTAGASSLWYFPVPVYLAKGRRWGSYSRKGSCGRGDDVVTPELLHDAFFAFGWLACWFDVAHYSTAFPSVPNQGNSLPETSCAPPVQFQSRLATIHVATR
ncbi:hypothetical protein BJY52DRAFT_1272475 [Lactarius psammicola]|nr:hypothetical protein BJY52DRAFT_1272475 [Lactarius psammicola]